ncbi:MAG: dGTP triphosphohydrolase [Promethearchaeota archaeon]
MCLYSTFWNNWEKKNFAPYSVFSNDIWYTQRSENDTQEKAFDTHGSRSRYRTAFEIDKDRIAKSQAFRRMEYKTQIFVTHEGDNYRTRLTHSLEVSEAARHIARALRLNEHLVEAISLGHDLGHAPYGHTGEQAINEWLEEQETHYSEKYYFSHNQQSVENIDFLEPGYDWDSRENSQFGKGLNVTRAVKEGILRHASFAYRGVIHQDKIFDKNGKDFQIINASKRNIEDKLFSPGSLEAQVVRVADDIAQKISDLEDGIRSNILKKEHIIDVIIKSFSEIRSRIFPKDDPFNSFDNIHICHAKVGGPEDESEIPIYLLYQIKGLINQDENEFEDTKEYTNYKEKILNDYNDSDKEIMKDAALIAFLLHMWRDADILSNISGEEQEKHRTRILKYLKLYQKIKSRDLNNIPSYHLIGFLRGILLANVIEHSFWNLHYCLNKKFSRFLNLEFENELEKGHRKSEKTHLIFAVVDGLIQTNSEGKGSNYIPVDEETKLHHFQFDTLEEMDKFLKEHFESILRTNGAELLNLNSEKSYALKVDWLNKSETPEKTQYVFIVDAKEGTLQVPIENIKIYFTGYKELCPGSKIGERCHYADVLDIKMNACSKEHCPFYSSEISHPDINRVIVLHKYGNIIHEELGKLIKERIHNSPKVARMNRMGKKIIKFLLDEYLANPRIMHQRVWLKISNYPEARIVGEELKRWIDMPINEKEALILPTETYKEITEVDKDSGETLKNGRYCLIRRIISHVAGMTDRYIKNEYNRLTRGGGETEIPDETYFFM